ncbi:FadR/GntR family transcriptional regulator [Paenibacillus ginsengarvi]|uniref:FadR family transcriptional regulator n=1 Tax=Paenibacillus ginsengarvi TaxID=400777 RepID=A0A3B0C3K0_9BACL|nr:GntR family transcriptional regulator [Paenibacillus ginsengarvi]RKN80695.1 FadR family transcriptional regulator [Paenibacillus ginsengarvi]
MKPIEKAERYTLSKLVVQNLKQYMIENRMSAGSKLPAERELAQVMKVSRAILREALRSLESAGILEIRHGEGAFVAANSLNPLLEQLSFAASLSGETSRDMLELRYLLEAAAIDEALRRGARLPLAELDELSAAAKDETNPERAVEADVQLHLAVVSSLHNESLLNIAELFIRQAADRGTLAEYGRIAAEHERYMDALRGSDAEAAKSALREHLGTAGG